MMILNGGAEGDRTLNLHVTIFFHAYGKGTHSTFKTAARFPLSENPGRKIPNVLKNSLPKS